MLLSQPTVSEHIRYLEETVGEKLLHRIGREAVPTQAGRILYDYARKMLELRRRAVQALEQFRGSLAGSLLMGASTIPGTYILPDRIGRFRGMFPSVSITLFIAGSRVIADMLLEGRIEIAFTGATWHDVKLDWQEVWRDELVLAVEASNPLGTGGVITIHDLVNIPLIFRERGSGTRKVTEETLDRLGVDVERLQIVAELGSTEAVREGIKAGIGASIISSRAVEDDVRSGRVRIIPIHGVEIVRPFYMVICKRRQLSLIAERFRSFIFGERDGEGGFPCASDTRRAPS